MLWTNQRLFVSIENHSHSTPPGSIPTVEIGFCCARFERTKKTGRDLLTPTKRKTAGSRAAEVSPGDFRKTGRGGDTLPFSLRIGDDLLDQAMSRGERDNKQIAGLSIQKSDSSDRNFRQETVCAPKNELGETVWMTQDLQGKEA